MSDKKPQSKTFTVRATPESMDKLALLKRHFRSLKQNQIMNLMIQRTTPQEIAEYLLGESNPTSKN